mmetsp:Transcript_3026/g.7396  ORF Transcript_3026/g.7396 Transcript_3026/m.7396 type:complete len:219 (+) Transcript_3026:780-1436(+)
MHRKLLGAELLEAVGVLGGSRPRVRLPEAATLHLGVQLLVLGVDARARCVEETLAPAAPGGLQHVETNHRVVVHNDAVVGLDEPHAAHVGGEVEHVLAPSANLHAIVVYAEIHQVELVAKHRFLHVLIPLPVARDNVVPLLLEPLGEVAGDESPRPRDADPERLFRPVRLEGVLGQLGHLLLGVREGHRARHARDHAHATHGSSHGRRRRQSPQERPR